jgi:Flp pilus assembly pilin Flp
MSQLKIAYRQLASARGQTMTEYALILGTIAIVLISFYNNAGSIIDALVQRVDPLL